MYGVPNVGDAKRGPEGHTGYLLRQANHAFRMAVDRELSAHGMTFPQFIVLTMLAAYPGLSGADLARVAQLTPQTVNFILKGLVREGWITRKPDAQHGRVIHGHLTDQGRSKLDCGKRLVHAQEQQMNTLIGVGELAIVKTWLVAVAAHFDNS